MAQQQSNHFLWRRLHSLSGVVPLAFFLFEHLYSNSLALQGAERYNSYIEFLHGLPFLHVVEILVIIGPLFYHGIYGLFVATDAKNNVARYGFARNWFFFFQRVTGVITFVFVVYHVYTLRFLDVFFGKTVDFQTLVSTMSNPWMLAFYVVGLLSTTYHFANGLWSFGIVWGITISPRSQRISAYVSALVFVAFSVMGIGALIAFVSAA